MVDTTGVANIDNEAKKEQSGWFPVHKVQMQYFSGSETTYTKYSSSPLYNLICFLIEININMKFILIYS